MRSGPVALALVLLLAGCVAGPPGQGYPPECQGDGPLAWGALDKRTPTERLGKETDPRQPWRTVLALRGDPDFGLAVERGNATLSWFGNGTERLAILTVDPAQGPLGLTVTAHGTDCVRLGGGEWSFDPPRQGAVAEVGKGVLAQTAGFLENGTLFYTNMPEVHAGPDADGKAWPRVGWYAWGGEDPLQVYVYDRDRGEMPAHWGAGGSLPVETPQDRSLPGRYGTTIPGFNEALKGLSTSTVTAVRIPPEQAYTRPGYESHPLYGEALVFLIRIAAVADQPCPLSSYDPEDPGPPQPACFRR